MPSPEPPTKTALVRLVLLQEARALLAAPALWIMLGIGSILVGYSFIQAVELFSQASRTALAFPELAAGMDPLQGILVPTFGAYYLTETLLLPFVAIRLLGRDKRDGTLKLLLQLPLSPTTLCGLKLVAMSLLWLLTLLPAAAALLVWHRLGGYVHRPALFLLVAGHALYSLVVITIGMFAAALADSLPTAAMFCLAATLGSWVLDFAAAGRHGLLARFGGLSLTATLRQFESGLFSGARTAVLLALALVFFLLAVTWLHPGRPLSRKIRLSAAVLAVGSASLFGALRLPGWADLTENRIHSFNPADARALKQLKRPLVVTIHMDPGDSRVVDLERDVLAKLRRCLPHLKIRYAPVRSAGLFGAPESDDYGLIEYAYGDRRDRSHSNSPEEILPLIYKLAGRPQPTPDPVPPGRGHPLVATAGGYGWLFYLFLPALFLAAGVRGRRGFGRRQRLTESTEKTRGNAS